MGWRSRPAARPLSDPVSGRHGKEGFRAVAAIHQVVNAAGILDTRCARHEAERGWHRQVCQRFWPTPKRSGGIRSKDGPAGDQERPAGQSTCRQPTKRGQFFTLSCPDRRLSKRGVGPQEPVPRQRPLRSSPFVACPWSRFPARFLAPKPARLGLRGARVASAQTAKLR